jgi:integrase/recombinase XerD
MPDADVSLTAPTLQEMARAYVAEMRFSRRSDATVKKFLAVSYMFMRAVEARGVGFVADRTFVCEWFAELERRGLSRSTSLTYFRALSVWFRWIEGEYRTPSPMARLKPPTTSRAKPEPFTDEQVDALLEAARRGPSPLRDEAMLMLAFDTGLRASELVSLRLCDVRIEPGRVHVRHGKGDAERYVPFSEPTGRCLTRLLSHRCLRGDRPGEDAPLFLSKRGEHLTVHGFRQLVSELGKKAGIRIARCSPHICRHTYAISFLRNGGNLYLLSELLGHSSITVTTRYLSLSAGDIDKGRNFAPMQRHRAPVAKRKHGERST